MCVFLISYQVICHQIFNNKRNWWWLDLDTWFRPPFWDLLMLQLLRPNSSNLPCLYSTFHLEYPLVLSPFCFAVMENKMSKKSFVGKILSTNKNIARAQLLPLQWYTYHISNVTDKFEWKKLKSVDLEMSKCTNAVGVPANWARIPTVSFCGCLDNVCHKRKKEEIKLKTVLWVIV